MDDFEPRDFVDGKDAKRLDRYGQFSVAATRLALALSTIGLTIAGAWRSLYQPNMEEVRAGRFREDVHHRRGEGVDAVEAQVEPGPQAGHSERLFRLVKAQGLERDDVAKVNEFLGQGRRGVVPRSGRRFGRLIVMPESALCMACGRL